MIKFSTFWGITLYIFIVDGQREIVAWQFSQTQIDILKWKGLQMISNLVFIFLFIIIPYMYIFVQHVFQTFQSSSSDWIVGCVFEYLYNRGKFDLENSVFLLFKFHECQSSGRQQNGVNKEVIIFLFKYVNENM